MKPVDADRRPADLLPAIDRMFGLSADKVRSIDDGWSLEDGAPVFTVGGCYTARGWT